jgi:hypothetical protein
MMTPNEEEDPRPQPKPPGRAITNNCDVDADTQRAERFPAESDGTDVASRKVA